MMIDGFDRPDFFHETPTACVTKLFNMIQACRVDASIMRGRKETYKIDFELIKVAEALVSELKSMSKNYSFMKEVVVWFKML